ncbi:MAG TPA: flavin reductase family protein [Terracidiphilus sp.]|nr:flavin reductase family protein [Terracidiphilus sp.]HEX4286887.1 flavin reductase family protein [Terracidiphilus sp.]
MKFDLEKASHSEIYKLLIGLIAPRPIALITSMDEKGRLNAAPFSAFNYLGTDPPIVAVGVANRVDQAFMPKDTARNIRRTGEFVVNVVTEDLAEKMNICAIDFPEGMNEVEIAGFTTTPSQIVRVPRIAESHAALECREHTTLEIGRSRIILGRVVAIYVEDKYVDPAGPYIKAEELHAVGRMNGLGNYVRTRDAFLKIPRMTYEDWKKRES